MSERVTQYVFAIGGTNVNTHTHRGTPLGGYSVTGACIPRHDKS